MPLISVITPVHSGANASLLMEAYASVTAQELPAGWSWEWVVQQDGRTGESVRCLPDDPRIRVGRGRQGGAGVARTLGLARAQGEVVRALDADDLLTPGALARDIQTLEAHPDIGWCVSGCLDLLPDGSLVPGPYDPPEGPLTLSFLREAFVADAFPVVGTHLAVRAPLLRALGGWPAFPALEALAVVLFCAAVSPGRMIARPGGVYRKHLAQTTAGADYWDAEEFITLRTAITSRLDALQSQSYLWPLLKTDAKEQSS
ncbi:glycosyltransferase (plasmid) [Streptomyces althioticus]|uniref:glycosyltransferase n=1 Tax=Streptomyces althioticus TaxID=83380 RepID=UPI002F9175C5|nr:glycosyltransferase [Streptomyces althioticus]